RRTAPREGDRGAPRRRQAVLEAHPLPDPRGRALPGERRHDPERGARRRRTRAGLRRRLPLPVAPARRRRGHLRAPPLHRLGPRSRRAADGSVAGVHSMNMSRAAVLLVLAFALGPTPAHADEAYVIGPEDVLKITVLGQA